MSYNFLNFLLKISLHPNPIHCARLWSFFTVGIVKASMHECSSFITRLETKIYFFFYYYWICFAIFAEYMLFSLHKLNAFVIDFESLYLDWDVLEWNNEWNNEIIFRVFYFCISKFQGFWICVTIAPVHILF